MEAALGIFLASLAGSPHCAAMCGPFLAFAAAGAPGSSPPPAPRWHILGGYHAGRLVAYLGLGAAGGALGAGVESLGALAGLSRAAALVAGVIMVAWGADTILAIRGRRAGRWHAPAAMQRALGLVIRRVAALPNGRRSAATGLATALLPCGWLYAFVAAASGTGSPVNGMLVMLMFWTGTLPVMLTLGLTLQRMAGPVRRALPLVSASVVVAIGLLTIAGRLRPSVMRHAAPVVQVHDDHR